MNRSLRPGHHSSVRVAVRGGAVLLVLLELALGLLVMPLRGGAGGGAIDHRAEAMRLRHEGAITDPDVLAMLLRTADEVGIPAAIDALHRWAGEPGAAYAGRHALAHGLGQFLYERTADLPRIMRECANELTYGCYHGATFAMVAAHGTGALDHYDRRCREAALRDYPPAYEQCLHGVGHALAHQHGDDLTTSLRGCDRISPPEMLSSCRTAVFMQNFDSARIARDAGRDQTYLRPADPLYPCTAVEPVYQVDCIRTHASAIALHTGNDFRAMAEVCRSASALREHCIDAIGAYSRSSLGLDEALARCRSIPERQSCALGALRFPDIAIGDMTAACADLDGDHADRCAVLVARAITTQLPPDARPAACSALGPRASKCRESLR